MNSEGGDQPALSPEQVEIIRLVACGFSDRQIANRLSSSEATVQRRLQTISESLGAASRVRLVVRAIALGVIDAADTDPDNPAQCPPQVQRS